MRFRGNAGPWLRDDCVMAHRLVLMRGFGRRWVLAAGLSVVLASECTSPAPHAVTAGLTAGCSTQVAASRLLGAVRPVTAPVPGSPTAVVGTADGRWAFASVSADNGGEIAVMALGRGTLRLVRAVPLPGSMTSSAHDAQLTAAIENSDRVGDPEHALSCGLRSLCVRGH
jgi:hypothetical protein